MVKMNKNKELSSKIKDPRKTRKGVSRQNQAVLDVLMKFRLVVNTAKRHYSWIEKQCGVSGAHMWALAEIKESPDIRASDLAAVMAIHQTTVSNLLDKLESQGHIRRNRSANDRRTVTLSLTKSGEKLVDRAPHPARGILPDALLRLDPPALQTLAQLLDQVLGKMNTGEKKSMKKPLAEILSGMS
jgi:DNA-binding MarR family transcriptional regulator